MQRIPALEPAALNAYRSQTGALAAGVLDPKLRERIAVVTAGTNRCDYLASVRTMLGRGAGVADMELALTVAAGSARDRGVRPRLRRR